MLVSRYVARAVINATLLVIFILLGLALFIAYLGEFTNLGKGDYGLWQAFIYVLLQLPQKVYSFLPIAGLLGVLLGLGELASHTELVALHAAGVSRQKISQIALQAAVVLILIATLLGECLAPAANRVADAYKTLATTSGQALKGKQGIWVRDGRNFIHIQAFMPDGRLQGISRYEFDEQQHLLTASYAQQAVYHNHSWHLQNLKQSYLSEQQVNSAFMPQAQWQLSFSPKSLHIADVEPEQLSLVQLYAAIKYLKVNHLGSDTYRLVFWKRLLQPIACLVMMWLGLPFIFGPLRSTTMGLRILTGTLLGFAFYLLNQLCVPIGLYTQGPPWLIVSLPIVIFAAIAYRLAKRNYQEN